jgi:hypothetical protein
MKETKKEIKLKENATRKKWKELKKVPNQSKEGETGSHKEGIRNKDKNWKKRHGGKKAIEEDVFPTHKVAFSHYHS